MRPPALGVGLSGCKLMRVYEPLATKLVDFCRNNGVSMQGVTATALTGYLDPTSSQVLLAQEDLWLLQLMVKQAIQMNRQDPGFLDKDQAQRAPRLLALLEAHYAQRK